MSVSLTVHALRVGSCHSLACLADRGAGLASAVFPATCALIAHPSRGWVLFDTGYSAHFFAATQRFPERLYRQLLPVALPPDEELTAQLARFGLTPADVGTAIVSHAHADHLSALRDLPNARIVANRTEIEALLRYRDAALRGVLHGCLPALLPEDWASRFDDAAAFAAVPLPAWMAPFAHGTDVFGDGSAIAVPLPGHTGGQIGLLIPDAGGRPVFLAADACWSLDACRAGRLPLVTFVNADRAQYRDTFFRLRALALREPSLAVLPSHCSAAWSAFEGSRTA